MPTHDRTLAALFAEPTRASIASKDGGMFVFDESHNTIPGSARRTTHDREPPER